jgi:putative membrane protein
MKSALCSTAALCSIALGCAAIFACTPARAQNAPPPPPPTSTTANQPTAAQPQMDKTFVQNAAEGGYAEVQFGKLAAQKASNASVKAFGQKMVQDHTALNEKMQPLVAKFGLTVPTQLSAQNQIDYDKLNQLSGPAFDMAYVSAMLSDHRKDLDAFRQEEKTTADPQLKATVASGEQVIQHHLQRITQIAKQIGVSVPPPSAPSGQYTPPPPAQ